jgi:hypothetical protein
VVDAANTNIALPRYISTLASIPTSFGHAVGAPAFRSALALKRYMTQFRLGSKGTNYDRHSYFVPIINNGIFSAHNQAGQPQAA